MRPENKECFVEIGRLVNSDLDTISLYHKVNWVIVHTSHKISKKCGLHGHIVRQKFRHTNWELAQIFYPELRIYKIPVDIRGDSNMVLKKWYEQIFEKIVGIWIKKRLLRLFRKSVIVSYEKIIESHYDGTIISLENPTPKYTLAIEVLLFGGSAKIRYRGDNYQKLQYEIKQSIPILGDWDRLVLFNYDKRVKEWKKRGDPFLICSANIEERV